jgi:myo-inositol-1(or 4)-monophosphatase
MHNNEIEIGVVYNPYLNELFYSEKGKGAFLNDRPLTVSPFSLKEGIIGFGSAPYYPDKTEKTFELLRTLFDHSLDVRRTGSAALDICYVAAGRFVLFFELVLSPWDYSAASLILTEAGGVITNLEQQPIDYTAACSVIAANLTAYKDFYQL